jgi:hypothetical protein
LAGGRRHDGRDASRRQKTAAFAADTNLGSINRFSFRMLRA